MVGEGGDPVPGKRRAAEMVGLRVGQARGGGGLVERLAPQEPVVRQGRTADHRGGDRPLHGGGGPGGSGGRLRVRGQGRCKRSHAQQ